MSTAAAVRPTSRAIDWAPIAGAAVLLVALTAARKPWAGTPPDVMFVRGAAIIGALALAFSFDDPAEATLGPSPTSLLHRRLTRVTLTVPAALGAIAVLIVCSALLAAPARAALETAPLLVEAGGVMLVALGLASTMPGAQAAGVLFTGILGAFLTQIRWPAWSLFPVGDMAVTDRAHVTWIVLAVGAVLLFVRASRDPAARRARLR